MSGWPVIAITIAVGFVWGITANYLLNRESFWMRVGVTLSCYALAALLVTIAAGVYR